MRIMIIIKPEPVSTVNNNNNNKTVGGGIGGLGGMDYNNDYHNDEDVSYHRLDGGNPFMSMERGAREVRNAHDAHKEGNRMFLREMRQMEQEMLRNAGGASLDGLSNNGNGHGNNSSKDSRDTRRTLG